MWTSHACAWLGAQATKWSWCITSRSMLDSCHLGPWPCVRVFVFVCVCVCVCLHVHWEPGRLACRLKAFPVKIWSNNQCSRRWCYTLIMHVYYVVMLHNLILHCRCILGNLCNEPKVYVVCTINLYRISLNMAHLDVLTLIATVSECCGNGLTIHDYI